MLILWRLFLLIMLFLGCLVCFPLYPNSAWLPMFMWFIIAFVAVILITFISSILMLGKSRVCNTIIDLAIIGVTLYFLLAFIPQTDGISPLNKIKDGKYPTEANIKEGVKKLNFISQTIKKDIETTKKDLNQGIGTIEKVMVKEAKN